MHGQQNVKITLWLYIILHLWDK